MLSQSEVAFTKLTQCDEAPQTHCMLDDETDVLTAPGGDLLPVTVRRKRMMELISDREFVRVSELADTFGISDVTVRGALSALETPHAVRRVRGEDRTTRALVRGVPRGVRGREAADR